MGSVDDGETLWFAELVEERGYNPFDLAAEVAREIILATKAAAEILQENIHHIPRSAPSIFTVTSTSVAWQSLGISKDVMGHLAETKRISPQALARVARAVL